MSDEGQRNNGKSGMKVYLAQLKCPSNHCVLALAGEYESPAAAQELAASVRAGFADMVIKQILKYECGLCLSRDLNVHLTPTRFRTMKEAKPFLEASERDQAASGTMRKEGRKEAKISGLMRKDRLRKKGSG